jgi:hypothetical protein
VRTLHLRLGGEEVTLKRLLAHAGEVKTALSE